MTTMASSYAYESTAGPVFDVADYSQLKAVKMGVIAIAFGTFIALGATYFWKPDLLVPEPSEIWSDVHQETKQLKQEHPQGVNIGVAVAGLFALLCLAGAISCFQNAASGNFYIRAGEAGLSLRVPDGFLGAFQRDFAWTEIAELTVVQEKQLGALSRNSGNLGGELKLRTHDGLAKDIRLDHFRQDAWLIHQRIEEAKQMRVAEMTVGAGSPIEH